MTDLGLFVLTIKLRPKKRISGYENTPLSIQIISPQTNKWLNDILSIPETFLFRPFIGGQKPLFKFDLPFHPWAKVNCKCVRTIVGAWQQNCYMYYRVVKRAFLYFPMNNTEIRHAQRVSQPRSWNCSLRKMAIATAIMKLFTAQSGYRNRDGEIAHCAKGLATAIMKLLTAQRGYRNRDGEIAHCAKWLSQPR